MIAYCEGHLYTCLFALWFKDPRKDHNLFLSDEVQFKEGKHLKTKYELHVNNKNRGRKNKKVILSGQYQNHIHLALLQAF
jgi:hypothetical protein